MYASYASLPTAELTRSVASRDIALEMASFMLGRPGCSRVELREQFSERQIDRYAIEAKNIADKRSVRRVA